MWESVAQVSNVFALLSVIAVVVGEIFRRRYLQNERLIKSAPQKERAALVEAALDRFSVSTEDLTHQKRYELAMEQLRQRAERFKWALVVGLVGFLVAGGLSAWAWSSTRQEDHDSTAIYRLRVQAIDPQGGYVVDGEVTVSASGELQEVPGGWEVNIPKAGLPADGRLVVQIQNATQFLSGSAEIVLGDDPAPRLTVPLRKAEVEIFGIISDSSGTAVAGVRVGVVGHPEEAVETGSSGEFRLPSHGADGESVQLRAEKDGYDPVQEWRMAGDHAVSLFLETEDLPAEGER